MTLTLQEIYRKKAKKHCKSETTSLQTAYISKKKFRGIFSLIKNFTKKAKKNFLPRSQLLIAHVVSRLYTTNISVVY